MHAISIHAVSMLCAAPNCSKTQLHALALLLYSLCLFPLKLLPSRTFCMTGIMLFRNGSLPFVKTWVNMIESDDKLWEQHAFNRLAWQGQVTLPDDPQHYFLAANGTTKMGVLPVVFFANGHVFFVQQMHGQYKVTPYAVHTTYTFSKSVGKRHRLREARLWVDGEEYYRPVGESGQEDGGQKG